MNNDDTPQHETPDSDDWWINPEDETDSASSASDPQEATSDSPGGWINPEDETNSASSASSHWRPGSPVTPVGSSYRGGSNGANQPTDTPTRRRSRLWSMVLIALLVVGSAGLGIGVSRAVSSSPSTTNASAPTPISPNIVGPTGSSGTPSDVTAGAGAPSDVSTIVSKVDSALVDINSTFGYAGATGAGTGIVLTSNGEIVTNNHVVDGATKISVTDVGNGKTYSANVVGYDPSQDIAVLQLVGASGLSTANIGNSTTAQVGASVVGIGNAGGTGGTPTSAGGSITALNQDITAADSLDGVNEQLTGLIAVNADIQAGDSGGALVNTAGQVIGIDVAGSASLSFRVTSSTQGFAIPINSAMTTVKQIVADKGSSTIHVGATAFLGVLVTSSSTGETSGTSPFGGNFGFNGNSGGTSGTGTTGAVIGSVVSGSPASQAGLTGGDVVTSVAGKTITSATQLSSILIGYHPGQKVQIQWTNTSGQTQTATITLASGPPA